MNDNETPEIEIWDEVTVNTNRVLSGLEEKYPDFKEKSVEDGLENLLEEIRSVAGAVFVPISIIVKFGKTQIFLAQEAAKKDLAIVPIGMYTDTRGSRITFGFLIGPEAEKLHVTAQQYIYEFTAREGARVH